MASHIDKAKNLNSLIFARKKSDLTTIRHLSSNVRDTYTHSILKGMVT
jgi:hypothetical protein